MEPGNAAAPVPPVARPHRNLLVYYALTSLLLGPLFFVLLVPLYFKYRSLRYELDEEGVSMRWGVLFRREIHLTYARIQDIHLTSNVVERWLGLGKVQVQTASGSSKAEMVIEGRQDFEPIRDFLYRRMRGMRDERRGAAAGS
ncbi:MAG TPA: PH domain-containing protein, partial [Thermoanaerobaculia bacterium]|nr:PH domain-containing protein [Thermoanaerobaculia bacterium]